MTRANTGFDPYHKWLGIPKERQPPNVYELLAISLNEEDPDVIRAAVEQRRRFIESKRGEGREAAVGEILYQIGEAEVTLLDPAMRRDYDRRVGLFEKRRRARRIDPNAPRARVESRPGRTAGEDRGTVRGSSPTVLPGRDSKRVRGAFGSIRRRRFRLSNRPTRRS